MPAAIVPNPVPEAVANTAEARKVIIRNIVGPTPAFAATPAIPAASPETLKTLENTPANIQHTIGTRHSSLAIPEITTCEYCFLSFDRKKGIKSARKAGTQSAPSEIDPQTKVVIIIVMIKITNGKRETPAPP